MYLAKVTRKGKVGVRKEAVSATTFFKTFGEYSKNNEILKDC